MNKADQKMGLEGPALAIFAMLLVLGALYNPKLSIEPNVQSHQSLAYTSKVQRFNDYLFEGIETKTAIA